MSNPRGGFTLMELATAIVIILILAVLILQSTQGIRNRAEYAKCVRNLGSLYVGVSNYMAEQGHWPQIDPSLEPDESARQWQSALAPFGVGPQTWVCPTIQRLKGSPDLSKPENIRLDYAATPFDAKPRTPYRWSTQPWFIEKGSPHPGGNIIIYEDGTTLTLVEAANRPNPLESN